MRNWIGVVLAKAREALRLERVLYPPGLGAAKEFTDRGEEVAVAHEGDDDIGAIAAVRHGNIEVINARADISHDRGHLRAAIGLGMAVDIDPHRAVVFADAVGAAGDAVFGAEGDLEKPVGYLRVREYFALGSAVLSDPGVFAVRGRRGSQ